MTKSLSNIRIYGDDLSAVAVAPKGSTMPTDLGALDVAFDELGWLSTDGVAVGRKTEAKEFYGFQGGTLVRTKRTSKKDSFKFQCLEETAITLGLMYPGSTSATASGVTTITVPEGIAADERAWVVTFIDDDVTKRYAIPRGEVVESADIVHKNDEMTIYEFTVNIYGEFDIITDNPAAATA